MLSSKSLYLRGKHKKKEYPFSDTPSIYIFVRIQQIQELLYTLWYCKITIFISSCKTHRIVYIFLYTRNCSFYALLLLLLLFMEHIPCSLCRRHHQHILNIHMRRLRYGKINRFSNIVSNQILITCIYLIGTIFVSFEAN